MQCQSQADPMKKILFFLGLLIAQICAGGLIFIFFISSGMLIFYPALSPNVSPLFPLTSSLIGILISLILILAIPIISAVRVYRDSKKLINQGVDAWIPAGWALTMLFFWFPGLAVYLFLRKFDYMEKLKNQTTIING